MISGLVFQQKAWRRVGLWRCLAAVALVVSVDFLGGVAACALLGASAGRCACGGMRDG